MILLYIYIVSNLLLTALSVYVLFFIEGKNKSYLAILICLLFGTPILLWRWLVKARG